MEDYRRLVQTRSTGDVSMSKKRDKLHETKRRDAEIKAAAKNKRDEEKEKKRQEKVAERAVFREERAMTGSHSRRAHKDAREKERREMKKSSGSICEHGIWKCRICFPPRQEREKALCAF